MMIISLILLLIVMATISYFFTKSPQYKQLVHKKRELGSRVYVEKVMLEAMDKALNTITNSGEIPIENLHDEEVDVYRDVQNKKEEIETKGLSNGDYLKFKESSKKIINKQKWGQVLNLIGNTLIANIPLFGTLIWDSIFWLFPLLIIFTYACKFTEKVMFEAVKNDFTLSDTSSLTLAFLTVAFSLFLISPSLLLVLG